MVKEIKFNELENLLYSLGFVTVPTTGLHKIYQYPLSGTLVVLSGYKQQAYVRTVHLVG